jgi:hypothetical protein
MTIRSIRRLCAAILTLAFFLTPVASQAASSCAATAASLKGWYGLLVAGQTTAAQPVAIFESGAVLFDGVSSLSGSNIYGSTGSHNSLSGTYSVNSDCTLTISATVGTVASTYTVAIKATGEAVGIETDAAAVSTISLKPQYATYTTGLNFTTSSLNGTFAASCGGFVGAYSDVNLVVFNNGTLTGTDPYNNDGSYLAANNPYSGSYTVNSDGTFKGTLTVSGTQFNYYGVISTSNTVVQYFYTTATNTPVGACTGSVAAVNTGTSQTISFNPIGAQKVGATLALSATASSGLAVSFASSSPAVCTVSGSTATFVAPGTCGIVASQPGNSIYSPATSVTQSFTVSAAAGTFTLSASASSVTVTPPLCVLFLCIGGSSATDGVTVAAAGGFTGTVSFSVSGLPTGVTASFSPASVATSGKTTLTLTPGSGTASLQSTTLTITGTSGSTTASTKVTLNY